MVPRDAVNVRSRLRTSKSNRKQTKVLLAFLVSLGKLSLLTIFAALFADAEA
jgi:hypothetical protein